MLKPLLYKGKELNVLDQRKLPHEESWVCCKDATDVVKVIRQMVVRGAPAIGIAGAYGYLLGAHAALANGEGISPAGLEPVYRELAAARPTAVNLVWALDRMASRLDREAAESPAGRVAALVDEAQAIDAEDLEANLRMSQAGAALVSPGKAVLTHCNTGALATGGQGTALGVIRDAWAAGRIEEVFVDETRPWLQGARLTAWELQQESIPYRLICDSAAASVLASGRVGWVIVGADRIAANGDTANKIGTYSLAVLARHHGVKFMVVAPTSTIDRSCPDGAAIEIEQRPPEEVRSLAGQPVAPIDAPVHNPSFDVTPAGLIDALVTEAGVLQAPDRAGIDSLFR
ncbi:S-methyl-5-thioribose-1-phosphate isomerase [Guyparkeria sp.]|uniref:S-methyl-5-thioribose-1-phosphate isomerase n=1 Tax=Guyparkeria sp. TaxID=2035736 RepID=UPI00356556F5